MVFFVNRMIGERIGYTNDTKDVMMQGCVEDMLTGIHVAIIGGDARQIEVMRILSEMDAGVSLYGFDQLDMQFSGVSKYEFGPDVCLEVDAVILPAVGTDAVGIIESIFTTKELLLTRAHIQSLPKHAVVYTGLAQPYLKKLCSNEDIKLVELFDRDDVAIFNSIPTAEGAIMIAIKQTDFTIHSSNCLVLGMGRTGLTLARVLHALGAHVTIGVNRTEQYARAYEMGFKPFYTTDLASEVDKVNLIFNTIPTMIITAQVIAHIPSQAVIIDLASKPGGTDFRFAGKRGVRAILAPGLPGIVAPKTAGQIIARALSQLILDEARKRGNDGWIGIQ
jgi:dipicolinate synthase subunit A